MNKHISFITLLAQMSHALHCKEDFDRIEVVDMTKPTTWRALNMYYGAMERRWKVCINCGTPDLGTGIHLEHSGSTGSMHPAVIPAEYLLSRLTVVDVSTLTTLNPAVVLTLDVALQWAALKHDPKEPTLLLFRFGWTEEDNQQINVATCVCKVPGIAKWSYIKEFFEKDSANPNFVFAPALTKQHIEPNFKQKMKVSLACQVFSHSVAAGMLAKIANRLSYELAEWIAANLTHVVGVATDTPTFESEQTREFASRTVSNVLGRSGVYMIENVHFRRMPDQGCMALVMPLKLLNVAYVPTRLTAFCPATKTDLSVVMALRKDVLSQTQLPNSRVYDVNLDEILS